MSESKDKDKERDKDKIKDKEKDKNKEIDRQFSKEEASATVGTQRVYKKTSPNSILTMYLPTREIVSCGTQPSILKGILFVDPKSIQGYRVYAQLTLTFRYGREDEEVMGLRFCNEAIMSLYQIYPRTEEPKRDSLTPLQDALIKRLGIGAYPFTLSLSPQSPPSVQLVPAKRYYGAPIGTSYDVRCFIADKTDDKFHRKATVKMGVRVIHKTDIFSSQTSSDNFSAAALLNNPISPPPPISPTVPKNVLTSTNISINTINSTSDIIINNQNEKFNNPSKITGITTSETLVTGSGTTTTDSSNSNVNRVNPTTTSEKSNTCGSICGTSNDNQQKQQPQQQQLQPIIQQPIQATLKSKKQERVDSFPKIRLSPKSFRFSGRFGRSKSEVERGTNDPFYNYSKSFHEVTDFSKPESCGPQGAVDKPFLLQEGRVCLRASLNKSWYTHGENVIVTVNIKNESKKTVRKIRVCAIQHVDVCMFNNGKFKNVVADSDNNNLPSDQTTVGPGKNLNSTIILTPKRGPTKNWIALEDSLQRCSEPDEIIGDIAASAVRIPTINPIGSSPLTTEDRNVFAIYVSYYVKVKLTLSGMGGELSLKLPFSLVHIGSSSTTSSSISTTGSETYKTITNEIKNISTNKMKEIEKPISIIKANSTGTQNNSSGQTAKDKSSVFSRQAKGHASDDDIIDIADDDYDIIKTDNSKSCEHQQYTTTNECSYGTGTCGINCPGGNNCNKNLHSLERIDSIEDEIPIQIPNKNLQKRRLTRSDIRVKDSSQEDEEDIDEALNAATTTTIIDALVHRTMKIESDQIEIHTNTRNEIDNSDSSNIPIVTTANTTANTTTTTTTSHIDIDEVNIIDNNSSNKCDIQKIIQQDDDNNVPINNNNDGKSNIEDLKNTKSLISETETTTTVIVEQTATTDVVSSTTSYNNNNDNKTVMSNQQHHIQTTCAQIHMPHDS
ncbi:uncharacterized protein LOC129618427 [Condylostylus longicornis]|uniref:uncharacterized protein LOC129618427 n=1 Tax=Condylostylus longicornis TaxID=2530218 RepID=UPI00244DFF78|nr:uncharacterized protein LOC129618427 [Condylostylus longicornis]